ncbi:TfoX/Sxy family DNA transformation protein [Microbulbifer spongiae]|uniref:TfoX/Sxy family protein n=1 Tax=Microbulbifer spongiae TaxID=2944933 RepID=A0ABY9EBJ1_9GAMM|nr:TfoX/Sxy family DNA transformation protein [Microbulbifer sp. MI-G]WKD49458.1 TfoX/Sxy family protein [Microbulbifer sp. MI-G]
MSNRTLLELKNIGKTVASRLYQIGITNEAELRKLGSAKAYRWLLEKNTEKQLPVCYYLYSLEGAIQDRHWDAFSEREKTALRLSAGLTK